MTNNASPIRNDALVQYFMESIRINLPGSVLYGLYSSGIYTDVNEWEDKASTANYHVVAYLIDLS